MKGTNSFNQKISSYLELRAIEDSLFAETLKKPNKSLEECVNYIFDTVQKSGCTGFDDDEIYKMAVHYYDEDDIKATGKIQGRVVVNHMIDLTESDLESAKKQAMERAINEAKKDIKLDYVPELNEAEMAEAKKKAVDKAVVEAQKKMLEKKKPKSNLLKVTNTDGKSVIEQPDIQGELSLF